MMYKYRVIQRMWESHNSLWLTDRKHELHDTKIQGFSFVKTWLTHVACYFLVLGRHFFMRNVDVNISILVGNVYSNYVDAMIVSIY